MQHRRVPRPIQRPRARESITETRSPGLSRMRAAPDAHTPGGRDGSVTRSTRHPSDSADAVLTVVTVPPILTSTGESCTVSKTSRPRGFPMSKR